MPVLNTDRETKRIILKESSKPNDEAWVDVYTQLLAADMIGIDEFQNSQSLVSVAILSKVIKAWNFVDGNGNALPITMDTVKYLPLQDMAQIIQEVQAFSDLSKLSDAKKKP